MKIRWLQISNILSFKHFSDISNADIIRFDDDLTILIGENGSGKSTALEVLNFIFRRVFFRPFTFDDDAYGRVAQLDPESKRNILSSQQNNDYNVLRLNAHWGAEREKRTIRVAISLDDVDKSNIENILKNRTKILECARKHSKHGVNEYDGYTTEYTFDLTLSNGNTGYSINFLNGSHDFGIDYLMDYIYYKHAIQIYNFQNATNTVNELSASFTLIGGYRNYQSFSPSVSLQGQPVSQQIKTFDEQLRSRSLNSNEASEPSIFGIVKLALAKMHYDRVMGAESSQESVEKVNKSPLIQLINDQLRITGLEFRIRFSEQRTWQYMVEFFDHKRNRVVGDINSLSAGQKAIIHLIFEAYGNGDLKGGLIIIDEPEIHLHYQFQNEYLQVINKLNKQNNSQYVLVTHSDALINSSTVNHVRRFSLSETGYTKVYCPTLNADQRTLIKVLDNTRSTYAFFAKKVVLVEGDSDRYFIKAALNLKHPQVDQQVAVLHIGGKNEYEKWKNIFGAFGLQVFFVADFDFITNRHYKSERAKSLKNAQEIQGFKQLHADWEQKIESDYINNVFVLKNGDLEHYLNINKNLESVIQFCISNLDAYLKSNSNLESIEIVKILDAIAN